MSNRVGAGAWCVAKRRALARWLDDPIAILMRLRRLPKRDTSADDLVRAEPAMTVVIASTPRTGSTLLAERLEATGRVGIPREYLNDRQYADAAATASAPVLTPAGRVEQQWRRLRLRRNWECVRRYEPESVCRYFDDVVARRTGPNGVFAIKIHSGDLDTLARRFGLDDQMFPEPVRWVHVTRRDRLAQAVSWVRAANSGEWVKDARLTHRPEPVRYDEHQIEETLRKTVEWDDLWTAFFAERDVDPIEVVYEDMITDIDGTRDRVLRDLGLEGDDDDVVIAQTSMCRQSDRVNEEWIERFRRDRPDWEMIGR